MLELQTLHLIQKLFGKLLEMQWPSPHWIVLCHNTRLVHLLKKLANHKFNDLLSYHCIEHHSWLIHMQQAFVIHPLVNGGGLGFFSYELISTEHHFVVPGRIYNLRTIQAKCTSHNEWYLSFAPIAMFLGQVDLSNNHYQPKSWAFSGFKSDLSGLAMLCTQLKCTITIL